MYTLGISCYYHDAAACLLSDEKIIAAAQEERFTRRKHDPAFPYNAIKYCLEEANITLDQVDHIIFYDDPTLKFKRILKTYVDFFPKSIPFIFKSLPIWLSKKLYWKSNLKKEFSEHFSVSVPSRKISCSQHHLSHAASAFYPSPFEDAAILVLDGVGEFATTTIWHGQGNKIKLVEQINFPHSLGLLYSAMTSYAGFKVNSGEYKVMGLAPYGAPQFAEKIKNNLIKIDDKGLFKMDMSYFDYAINDHMTNDKFNNLFEGLPREKESTVTQKEMDIARSIQEVTEEVMMKLAKYCQEKTGSKNLCMAGGVALNCVANGKILNSGVFKNVWIQPAAGDAGGALGAAYVHYYKDHSRKVASTLDSMQGSYLGPQDKKEDIKAYLDSINAKYHFIENEDQCLDTVAEALKQEKVVGWHSGRMEFGPRALGARSIIGDSRSTEMQKTMNLKIKYRESFRPFAPSVLRERVSDYFQLNVDSPYMLIVAPVADKIRKSMTKEQESLFGIDKLNIPRSTIPAVTHVDYSARVQTVHKETNPRYYNLIKKFEEKTGYGVLVNTSFNVRGEPIVCTPEDSYRCFMRTEMDVLVIENFVLYKQEQPNFDDKQNWKSEFELD